MGCHPNSSKLPPNAFNLWKGFKAQLQNNFELSLIQPLLDFIKVVWCNNDDNLYKYLLSWLHCLLVTPWKKSGHCIFAYSKQGCGKNTLTDFLRDYVIGKSAYYETVGIESIMDKHSEALEGRRLVVIDECSSTKGEFLNNFNKMKNTITGDFITVNPKNIRPYVIDNFCNLMIFTNHLDSLYLESSDRRYLCLKLSDVRCQDYKYFENLRNRCFNKKTGNYFYTFLNNLTDLVPLNKIPDTELRNDIKEISKPSIERFIDWLKEEINNNNIEPTPIPAKELYEIYSNFCEDMEIRKTSKTKFGVKIKEFIPRKHTRNGKLYYLNEIK